MKKKHMGAPHEEIVNFLSRQRKPVNINYIARRFGETRNAILVKITTLTKANPKIAEDDKGRVYLMKEQNDERA